MDSNTILAICTKIGQVFQWKNSDLAYPLGFISYDPVEFDELTKSPDSFSSLQNLSEFSHLVNLRPDGPIWSPEDTTPLWDVVSDIYASAIIADGSVDRDIDARLSMTAEELYAHPSDAGEKRRKYNQYQDRHELLLQRYRALESSVPQDSSNTTELEALRREIADLLTEWEERGYKLEIEGSSILHSSTSTESFHTTWAKWRSSLMEGLDFLTDGHQNRYVPTCYTPSDIVKSPSWVSIELDHSDIKSLLSKANPDLSARFGFTLDGSSTLTSIHFEATSVDLVRSWLPKDLFEARFWRFPDPERTVDWPGYVTGLILLRNIEVSFEKELQESTDNLVEGEHSSGSSPQLTDPIKQRRSRRFAIAFGVVLSVSLSIAIGGNPFIPALIAIPVAAALFYVLYRLYEMAMRRRVFRSSRVVSWLCWILFIAFTVILVYGIMAFNVFYGNMEAGDIGMACPKPPDGASIGDHVGQIFGCLFGAFFLMIFTFGFLITVVLIAAVMILVVWLLTRYQPIRRTTRYFRKYSKPALFDRMDDDPQKATHIDIDHYPKRIFVAGFRTRPLARAPNPDRSLDW